MIATGQPSEGARRVLASLAAELGAPREVALELDCSSLESIAAGLRPPAHTLRLIQLDRRALAHLEPPALALVDGSLAVLRTIGSEQVTLERASGAEEVVPAAELITRAAGSGIEIMRSLPSRGAFLTRLGELLATRGRDLVLLLALAGGLTLLGLLIPLLSELAVDRALPTRAPKLLSLLALGALLASLQRGAFAFLRQRALRGLSARVEVAVATRLLDHLLRIPYPALARENLGSWLETLQSGQLVQRMAVESILLPLVQAPMVLVYLVAIARRDAFLALTLPFIALLPVVLTLYFALRASRLESASIEAGARQGEALYETLSGVLTLRTAGAQGYAVLRWLERALEARSTAAARAQLSTRMRVLVQGAAELVELYVLGWAGYACLQGTLSVGELLSLVLLGQGFLDVVAQLSQISMPLLSLRPHLARVDRLLALDDALAPRGSGHSQVDARAPAVVLDDVWFRHAPDRPWVLRGRSLTVESKSRFVLSGPTGSGKTTILRIIAGLYAPERGVVQVLGHPPSRVRREICYLPQDAHLFQGTIRQNLELLSDGAAQDAIHAAAAQSGLADLVATMPMGYDTVLPPGATTLSGGQRQLIAWTAAMASGRRLLLMDEALSQVDRLTRARLLAMLDGQNRTTISVEHELS